MTKDELMDIFKVLGDRFREQDDRIAALEAEVRELKARTQTISIDMPDKTALELLQQRFPGVVPCKE